MTQAEIIEYKDYQKKKWYKDPMKVWNFFIYLIIGIFGVMVLLILLKQVMRII